VATFALHRRELVRPATVALALWAR
jgi:hypothetical protein